MQKLVELEKREYCFICKEKSEIKHCFKNYPITERYIRKGENCTDHLFYDIVLRICEDCGLMFLGEVLPKEFLYNSENYHTLSSTSIGAIKAIDDFAEFIKKHCKINNPLIIDVGANDTTLLRKLESMSSSLVGIDPNLTNDEEKYKTHKCFVEDFNFKEYEGRKKIIISSHTIEHLYEVDSFFQQISSTMSDDDEFFLQVPSLELLLNDCRFDQVQHQHLNYFSLRSLKKLANQFNLKLVNFAYDPWHYGAIMCQLKIDKNLSLQNQDLGNYFVNFDDSLVHFNSQMQITNEKLMQFKEFYCYGASLMLPILLYFLPNMVNAVAIIDANKEKWGLTYANFSKEIICEEKLKLDDSNFIISAVATKLAYRKILSYLIQKNAKNILVPINII